MDPEKTPDLYTDAVQIGLSPFGCVLAFALQPAGQTGGMPPQKLVNLRMSLEHAKVVSILLRKHLKNYEQSAGHEIPLHPQLLTQLGISRKEDW